jgi:hypothetical protein
MGNIVQNSGARAHQGLLQALSARYHSQRASARSEALLQGIVTAR